MWKRRKRQEKNQPNKQSLLNDRPYPTSDENNGGPLEEGQKVTLYQSDAPHCTSKKVRCTSCCSRKVRSDELPAVPTLAANIQRVLTSVRAALNTEDVHEKGVPDCRNCQINRENYKKIIKEIKIIEEIADDVVGKELRELMKADDEKEDLKGTRNASGGKHAPVKKSRQLKYSITFEIYSRKTVSKHNLKCFLITLQRMMADTVLQVCFVKTKNLGGEERFKHFDISINDLNLLKYQLTEVTDHVIELINHYQEQRKKEEWICVDCVKEEVTACMERLREVLQSGRSLKLIKVEGKDRDAKCCHRPYPHIHKFLQGKSIVFKFSKPHDLRYTEYMTGKDEKSDEGYESVESDEVDDNERRNWETEK